MIINQETGQLQDCVQCPSPNKDERPDGQAIDLIVVHSISLPPGEYGGKAIENFFQNRLNKDEHPYYSEIHEMQVSSHLLIKRTGKIIQFVPFHQRAWHAGQSNYQGRERCNDFSIGIELEGSDSDIFEDKQYQQLVRIITALQNTYPKISDNITGHSDISPGRKLDPGTGFDWQKLNDLTGASV